MNRTKRKKIVVIELVLLAGILSCIAVFYKKSFQTETPKQKTEKPQVHKAKKIKKTKEKKPGKKAEEMAEEKVEDTPLEPETQKKPEKLKALEEALSRDSRVAIFVCDLSDGESFSVRNGKMQAASLIKLYIAGAVYEHYDAVSAYLGEGLLQSEMKKMITVSDNAAANTFVKALGNGDVSSGMASVNDYCRRQGFSETVMGRLLLADRTHGDNFTSPADTGKILEAFYKETVPGGREILALMKEQTRREKIPAGLPQGVLSANKTGELADVENDAAVVYAEERPYICVFMQENVSAPGTARKEMADLSGKIYAFMTNLKSDAQKGVVAIDAGHQKTGNASQEPIGPGAQKTKAKVTGGTRGVATQLPEYVLTLQVAKKLEKALVDAGYQVVMIRNTDDVDLSNAQRAEIANRAGADAFIRLHANGCADKSVSGIMTICQTKNNPYNGALYEESHRLSTCVLDALVEATGARKERVSERDDMTGINYAEGPVTIVEMGYMTNPEEDRLLSSDAYQDKIVLGIKKGIENFMAKEKASQVSARPFFSLVWGVLKAYRL